MNHKYRKPKSSRSGCLLCKPQKHQALKRAARVRDKREAMRHEDGAY